MGNGLLATRRKSPILHPMATEPFRFFDNREKYLLFVSTTSEKAEVAARIGRELALVHPRPLLFACSTLAPATGSCSAMCYATSTPGCRQCRSWSSGKRQAWKTPASLSASCPTGSPSIQIPWSSLPICSIPKHHGSGPKDPNTRQTFNDGMCH